MVRYIPNEFELPCFQAVLHEAHSDTVGYSGGYGLHGDAEIALSRAVCEAAQSRLVVIHGGREDVTQFYEKYNGMEKPKRSATEAAQFRTFTDQTRCIDFSSRLSSTQSGGIAEQLPQLLQRLKQRGFHQVFRHVFQADLAGLAVVKIIVPRCEHVGHGLQRIGSRLMQRITENA
jgi:YcaO-like protein with predicted kinase domain